MTESSPAPWGRNRTLIEVRYGEVDQQGVVFNAHYMAWIDHALDRWLRRLGRFEDLGWDLMLVRAELTWSGSATVGDLVAVDQAVTRWGRTSFDVTSRLSVADREILRATMTHVGVAPGTRRPVVPPPAIRDHLGEAVPPPPDPL